MFQISCDLKTRLFRFSKLNKKSIVDNKKRRIVKKGVRGKLLGEKRGESPGPPIRPPPPLTVGPTDKSQKEEVR